MLITRRALLILVAVITIPRPPTPRSAPPPPPPPPVPTVEDRVLAWALAHPTLVADLEALAERTRRRRELVAQLEDAIRAGGVAAAPMRRPVLQ